MQKGSKLSLTPEFKATSASKNLRITAAGFEEADDSITYEDWVMWQ